MADGVSEHQERLARRWRFLESERDACCVVTRRMAVVYVNTAARPFVPLGWFGGRCWEIFPVGKKSCASRCPAVRAVSDADEIVYCEETLYSPAGSPISLGVAVIPVRVSGADGERAILLLRPKSAATSEELFQQEILERAMNLSTLCLSLLKTPSDL